MSGTGAGIQTAGNAVPFIIYPEENEFNPDPAHEKTPAEAGGMVIAGF